MIDVENLTQMTRYINAISRDSNFYLCYTKHCKEQMIERDITTADILYVLKTGYVNDYQGKGEQATDYNIHRYKMVGTCINRETGREIGVVLLVGIDKRLAPTIKIKSIVTAMWQD